jgi:hypothetical protein
MAKKKTNNSIVPVEIVQKAESDAALMFQQAESIQVATTEQEEQAYTVLTQIKQVIKTIEDKRKEITKPLNASLKATNTMFKKLSAPFVEADRIVRDKVMGFRQIQEEKAQKELERRQKIQNSHKAKGHETHEITQPKAEVSKETVVAKRWVVRISDPKKLPDKLLRDVLATDEGYEVVEKYLRKLQREAAKDTDGRPIGIDLPGMDIYQVEGLRV